MNTSNPTVPSATWRDEAAAAADGLHVALVDVEAPILDRPDRAAVALAALRDDGWDGEPAMFVAGHVLDGVTAREAESATAATRSVRDPWKAIGSYDVADYHGCPVATVREAAAELRAVLRRHRREGSSLPASGGSR